MVLFCRILIFFVLFWNNGATQIEHVIYKRQLVMSQMFFRHSNRTPLYIYKNSPCPLSVYSEGLGAITKDGVQHAFKIGQFLRDRYVSKFTTMSENFLSQIHVRSTDVDRCIQTVLTMLYSMFPIDGTTYKWDQNISWYPIPVHTFPANIDPELKSEESSCPKLKKILEERLVSKMIEDFLTPYTQLLNLLSEETGTKVDAKTIWNIYQTLKIEKMDSQSTDPICGKTPTWLTEKILTDFEQITYGLLNLFYSPNDTEYSRLLGGPLLQMIVKNFQSAVSVQSSKTKLFIYSAHDSTLYHLYSVFGITRMKYVDYLTTIILELYQDHNGNYEVELILHDDSTQPDQFEIIPLPKCPFPCSLISFIETHKDVISVDRDEECRI